MEQVLVGQLKQPYLIETDDKETVPIDSWKGRAIWSYLRLHFGKKIDDEIKDRLNGERMNNGNMAGVLSDLYPEKQRTLQFITTEDKQRVLAVASTRHLIVPPEVVYKTTEEILGRKLSMSANLDGGSVFVRRVAGLRYGVQIHGGSITTRFAIRIGALIRVELCFNPLSWLGVGNFQRFGIASAYERVLRIKRITDLKLRLETAISKGRHGLASLEYQIQNTKQVSMSEKTAEALTYALCSSYGLGTKTVKAVLERYTEEDQTQYGLAMALSWMAEHGETRKTPERQESHTAQKLSTVGAGVLLIDDLPKTTEKSRDWLKLHLPDLKI